MGIGFGISKFEQLSVLKTLGGHHFLLKALFIHLQLMMHTVVLNFALFRF